MASQSSLSILHHRPCSADSHLSGCTIATMSCWVNLVVLPQIHVGSLSFSTVSWYLWHVHHCWPMHSMSHFHCIMDYYGSRAVDTCGLYTHGVHCISVVLTPSFQSLLVLLDRISGFAKFTCGFIILCLRPMVYVASLSSLSILHHHPGLCVLCTTSPGWLLYILVDIIYVLICILLWFIH